MRRWIAIVSLFAGMPGKIAERISEMLGTLLSNFLMS